jgi:hypothetical protein
MIKKLMIVGLLLLIAGAAFVFGSMGAVLPWFVVRNEQPVTTVETYIPARSVSRTPVLDTLVIRPNL